MHQPRANMSTTLRPSQISTLVYNNERPGKRSTAAVGFEMAAELVAAGMITIKGNKCHPTALAAAYVGRSKAQQASDMQHAHAAVMGRYATM